MRRRQFVALITSATAGAVAAGCGRTTITGLEGTEQQVDRLLGDIEDIFHRRDAASYADLLAPDYYEYLGRDPERTWGRTTELNLTGKLFESPAVVDCRVSGTPVVTTEANTWRISGLHRVFTVDVGGNKITMEQPVALGVSRSNSSQLSYCCSLE